MNIYNAHHEKIDYLVEGNEKSTTTVVLVHGFAVDKHETAGYFDDVALDLGTMYRIVRFDFSGCGKSEGKLEEKNYIEWANDLKAVLVFVKNTFHGKIYIFAQSMGTFITALLSPDGVGKIVFTGIPNANMAFIKERIIRRFGSKDGAIINTSGISLFPRSSGAVQKIGPSFWTALLSFDPIFKVRLLATKTRLLIIHAKQDEIIGTEYLDEYGQVPNIKRLFLDGDHSWKNIEQRKRLIQAVRSFFST